MMASRRRDYSKLVEMFRDGKSYQQIGKAVGLAPSSARAYVERHGNGIAGAMKRKRYNDRIETIKQMAESGKTLAEIAESLDLCRQTVHFSAARHGIIIQLPTKTLTARVNLRGAPVRMSVLADLLNTNLNIGEIGRRHGVSRQRVSQIASEAKIAGIKIRGSK